MNTVIRWIGVILLVAAGGAFAAETGLRLEPAPGRRLDNESLQRGARNFVNYCLTCHSAQYMRYNRLTDLGLTEQQIKDNLMFATDKIGSTMTVAMSKADATAWFGAPPPDLSVEARVRGSRLAVQLSECVLSRRRGAERMEQPGLPQRGDAARAVERCRA